MGLGLNRTQLRAFLVTYVAYASVYYSRKTLSVAKGAMQSVVTTSELGVFDSAFLVAYAVGQFTLAPLGDHPKVDARYMTIGALTIAALSSLSFAFPASLVRAAGLSGVVPSTAVMALAWGAFSVLGTFFLAYLFSPLAQH